MRSIPTILLIIIIFLTGLSIGMNHNRVNKFYGDKHVEHNH